MRKREQEQFRKILEDRLIRLYRAAHNTVRLSMERQTDPEQAKDEGDEAQRVQARDLSMNLAESQIVLAQRIEEALRRITRGEYGQCVDCGGPIELSRLKLVPWAPRCIEDQEAVEFEGRDKTPSL